MSKKEGAAFPDPDESPDYQSGFYSGKQDGWSGRDYSSPEVGDRFHGNEDYLRGYNDGWNVGRRNPKPRGQLPPS